MFRLCGRIAIFSFLISKQVLAASAIAERAPSSNWTIDGEAAAGFGTFQDLQVPVSENDLRFRADGKAVGSNRALHYGVPIKASLGITYGSTKNHIRLLGEGQRIAPFLSPTDVADATYSRASLTTLGHLNALQSSVFRVGLIGGMNARRTMFQNVSSGHNVDSAIPLIGTSVNVLERWVFEVVAGSSIRSNMALTKGQSSKSFSGTNCDVTTLHARARFRLDRRSSISFGFEQEQTQVEIQTRSEYQSLGLAVSDFEQDYERFTLNTQSATIALEKNW